MEVCQFLRTKGANFAKNLGLEYALLVLSHQIILSKRPFRQE